MPHHSEIEQLRKTNEELTVVMASGNRYRGRVVIVDDGLHMDNAELVVQHGTATTTYQNQSAFLANNYIAEIIAAGPPPKVKINTTLDLGE